MNNKLKCIFNKNMRFEINDNYNPKQMELLKKLERPLPEIEDEFEQAYQNLIDDTIKCSTHINNEDDDY